MIKMIATDMDGTFLDSDKKFDQEFLDIFYQLKRKEYKVCDCFRQSVLSFISEISAIE